MYNGRIHEFVIVMDLYYDSFNGSLINHCNRCLMVILWSSLCLPESSIDYGFSSDTGRQANARKLTLVLGRASWSRRYERVNSIYIARKPYFYAK